MIKNFTGKAAPRTAAGLAAAAGIVGCDVAALHADVQVEAGSHGYDALKRPTMLFEPHLFYRNVNKNARATAVSLGLAYPNWGTRPYPKDSYPRLLAAMRLDPEAALSSASWGLPQILGSNHTAAGYATAEAMVQAFIDGGENEHLLAMGRFIAHSPAMRKAIIAHDWTTFAHLYNGPASKGYDTKLSVAYKHVLAISPEEANAHVEIKKAEAKANTVATGGGVAAVAGAAAVTTTAIAAPPGYEHLWLWLLAIVAVGIVIDIVATVVLRAKAKKVTALPAPVLTPVVVTPLSK